MRFITAGLLFVALAVLVLVAGREGIPVDPASAVVGVVSVAAIGQAAEIADALSVMRRTGSRCV